MGPPLSHIRQKTAPYLCAALGMLAAMLVIAAFTGQWPTGENAYHSYVLQACAWLEGRLDLGQDYSWLELAIVDGRYYVSFPPFPSYVMLPFAAVLGYAVPDNLIAWAVTLLGVLYAVRLCRLTRRNDSQTLFWALFLYLGTGYLFISMSGAVWFIAQTMCFTLSLMALTHAFQGQGGLSLTCWACAVGCRPMAALYLPLLIWLLWQTKGSLTLKQWIARRWYWPLPAMLIAGSYMALNQARFGNPFEFGHNYLPEFVRAAEGQFSLSYFTANLKLLLRLPLWDASSGTFLFSSDQTTAFWLINPMYFSVGAAWIGGLRRRRSVPAAVMLPILVAVHVFILCCHRTLGGWQFGNRYLLDMMPWLFAGLLLWTPADSRLNRWSVPLMAWGFVLNAIGTVATYHGWI